MSLEKTELYCIIIQNALLYTLYIIYIRHTNISIYIYIQNCKPVFCLQKNMTELSVHVKVVQGENLSPHPPTHTVTHIFSFFLKLRIFLFTFKKMNLFSFFEKCSGKLKYIHDSDSDPVNCTYPLPIPEGC